MQSNRIFLCLILLCAGKYCVAQDCGEANIRSVRAVQRAQRAVARSRIAVLRIHSELEAASVSGGAEEAKLLSLTKTPESIASAGPISTVTQLRDEAHVLATAAMSVMKGFYPQRYTNPVSVPASKDMEDMRVGGEDCETVAAKSDALAFAAEQWSQLADVAAEQAIELSARRIAAAHADSAPKP